MNRERVEVLISLTEMLNAQLDKQKENQMSTEIWKAQEGESDQ